jgi:hypothetical protein
MAMATGPALVLIPEGRLRFRPSPGKALNPPPGNNRRNGWSAPTGGEPYRIPQRGLISAILRKLSNWSAENGERWISVSNPPPCRRFRATTRCTHPKAAGAAIDDDMQRP